MNLEESIEMTVNSCGVELYDLVNTKEHGNNIFRILITSKDGISLDKCAEVSRLISPLLDVDEPMAPKYFLEVSSPGIERKLKKTQHYMASIGDKVRVKDYDKNITRGELLSVNDEAIVLKVEDEDVTILFSDISAASTYFEW